MNWGSCVCQFCKTLASHFRRWARVPQPNSWNRLRLWSQHLHSSTVVTRQTKSHLFSSFNALPPTPSHTPSQANSSHCFTLMPPPQAALQAKTCKSFSSHYTGEGRRAATFLDAAATLILAAHPPPLRLWRRNRGGRAHFIISKRHTGQDRPAVSLPRIKSHKRLRPSTPISGVVVCARPYSFGLRLLTLRHVKQPILLLGCIPR